MKASPYQTYAERYMSSSSLPRTLVRTICNRYMPQLRHQWSWLSTDGGLAKPDNDSFVELHGKNQFADPYKYMEHMHDSRTLQFLKLERKHAWQFDQRLDLQGGKHRLWQELDQRLLITTREGGFDKGEERIGDFIYYTRSKAGEDDITFHRKRPGQADALGDELIDTNELMRQFGYASCIVGTIRVSADGQYLAYTVSVEGGDRYICHVKSIDHGGMFHVIRSTNIINIEFGSNNSFFYTECNDLNRPFRVMMLELRPGILPEPIEVYRDEDERFFVDVRKTKDGKYMIISSDSKDRGNVLVVPASFPVIPKELVPLFPQGKPVEIAGKEAWGWLEHHGGCFIMVTSRDNSPNYKIVYAREEMVLHHGKAFDAWQDLLGHDPECQIQDVDIFESHLVVFENAFEFERQQQLRIIDLSKGGLEKADRNRKNHIILHFPALSQITPGLNKNFVQDSFNFSYSSIIVPQRECVYDFNSKLTPAQARGQAPSTLYTQRQHETLSPWDYMWPYHNYRDTYTSFDGTQVPITICQKRDVFVDEITEWEPMANTARFCLLYVYGSYGECPSLHFQPLPYMWMMRRRWICAFAHIRGGGEKPGWGEAGKGRNKMNGVHDLIEACKYLVDQGITVPSRLVVVGNSAGAVPIAAAMNMHGRDLFHLALLRAPFLDITGTMMNPELPLSLSEREDWGDPLNNAEDLEYLKKYDPYLNIRDDIDYPSMVISAALDDDRVPAWNAMKYAAKMREQRRKRNVDPLRWALHTRFPHSGGHYAFNNTVNVCEELVLTINHLCLPSTYYKVQDMDGMQQMHNFFKTGMMDHDDQQQTFLKWENWEREKIEYVQRLHTQEYEPNFRVLRAKKQPFYWSTTHDDGTLRAKAEKLAREGLPPEGVDMRPEGKNL